MMRGHVPEFDDTYIEKWLPESLVAKIRTYTEPYIDEEGFWWGPNYVCADKLRKTGDIVVIVATKPLGQGYHDLKVVDKNGNIMRVEGHELI
jgi:hypothetical protein